MFKNRDTLQDNETIKQVLENLFREKGYEVLSKKELDKKKEIPMKYILERASYKSIYGHGTNSPFLVINYEKSIKLRIEIRFQKTSGSVDEKIPYFYLNAVVPNDEDVLFIVEGDGFKKGAKKWLKDNIEKNWLNEGSKKLYYRDLIGAVKLLERII